jgi:hypothetical protein
VPSCFPGPARSPRGGWGRCEARRPHPGPQQSQTIYFDNGIGTGHYPENKYSLYRTSTNQVTITIEAADTGYAPATTGTTKSPGTGEKLD